MIDEFERIFNPRASVWGKPWWCENYFYRPQQSCGKVMFLHLYAGRQVSYFFLLFGVCPTFSYFLVEFLLFPTFLTCPTTWRPVSVILFTGGVSVWEKSLSRGGGLCPGGSLSGRPPSPIRLRAGGTHPTGMHSLFLIAIRKPVDDNCNYKWLQPFIVSQFNLIVQMSRVKHILRPEWIHILETKC